MSHKYTYRVIWSEKEQQHIGLCAEFPSLSHFADSLHGALSGIVELVADAVGDMIDHGDKLPEPRNEVA